LFNDARPEAMRSFILCLSFEYSLVAIFFKEKIGDCNNNSNPIAIFPVQILLPPLLSLSPWGLVWREPQHSEYIFVLYIRLGGCYFTCMSIGIFSKCSVPSLIASKSSSAEGLRLFAPAIANRSDADMSFNPSN